MMEVSQLLVSPHLGKSKFEQRLSPRGKKSGEVWMFPMYVLPRCLKREKLASNVFVTHVQLRNCSLAALC